MKPIILAFSLVLAYFSKSSAQNFGVENGIGYPFSTKRLISDEPFHHNHHATLKFKLRKSNQRIYGIALGYEAAYHNGDIQVNQLTMLTPTEGRYYLLQMGFFKFKKGKAKCLRGFGIGSQFFLNPILQGKRAHLNLNPFFDFSRNWPLSKHIERMYVGTSIRVVSIPKTGIGFTVSPTITLSYNPF